MNLLIDNAENNWPEDEAAIESKFYTEYFCVVHKDKKDKIREQLIKDIQRWNIVFENDRFLQRFVSEFNKNVPSWAKMSLDMLDEQL